MKNLFVSGFLLALFLSLSACNLPLAEDTASTTAVIPTAVAQDTTPTLQPAATVTSTPTEAGPTATPAATTPTFANLRFTTAADAAAQATFPAGTTEIFALWDYRDLTAGDTMKRVWYRNGEQWLVREEAWNMSGYGATGTVSDISVYDFEDGLDPGQYALQLYLNGALQLEDSFTVRAPAVEVTLEVLAPDGERITQVLNGDTLAVKEANGEQRMLAQALEIAEVVWFPDGRHILYVDRDTSERLGSSTLGIKHALRVVEVATGQETELGSFAEDLHSAAISENGRYLSLISGTGYGDACGVDRSLHVMALDDNRQRSALHALEDFEDAPASETYWIYPLTNGKWQGTAELLVQIGVTCIDLETAPEEERLLPGIYELQADTLKAQRIGDLPPQ